MIGTLLLPLLTLTQTLDSTYDRRALWLTHGPGMTGVVQGIQASPVGGGFFVVGADLLETAPDRIRLEYRASRAAFKRYTVFGGLQIAGMLATIAYYGGRHHPKWKPGWGIGLPVATFAVGWAGQVNATGGEDHLRRAMWWYNREFPRATSDSGCSYDGCAIRVQRRMGSDQLAQGVSEMPVGALDSQLQRFAAAGDSARAHYETFQALSRSERRVKRVFFGALLGAGLLYVASDKKIARDASQGLLLVAYGVGHLSLYGSATAERELDQAIWFYNRTRP